MLRQWVQHISLQSRTQLNHYLSKSICFTFSTTSIPFRRNILSGKSAANSLDPGEDSIEKHFSHESPKELLDNAAQYDNTAESPDDLWTQGPYPHHSNYKQSQAKLSKRPNIDPKETSIMLFPGQGTQYIGMGKNLLDYPNVKEMFDAASTILGYDLLKMCLHGPLDTLTKTVHQQPAIFVTSLAAVEKMREEMPSSLENCVGVAGFSLGEITALTFAGVFSFEDAIQLVKVRAEAMQLASELTPSGMMTVMYGADSRLGFACNVAKEFCQHKELPLIDCRIANYLYPHCKVVAGNEEALSFIEKNKSDFRLRRLKRLPVSGAFHTDLMKPAVAPLQEILQKIKVGEPLVPVHSNIDGKIYKNAAQVKKKLPKQICSPVKWEQTMHILYERSQGTAFPKTYECGPGNSLKNIMKMVNAKAWNSCRTTDSQTKENVSQN